MLSASCLGLVSAFCALLMTWLSALHCAAQHDPLATARSELANFSPPMAGALSEGMTLSLAPGPRVEQLAPKSAKRPWLAVAASTTAALAASYLVFEGLSYRATSQASRYSAGSREMSLDLDTKLRNREQFGAAQDRANFMSKVSDICLAGTVAATGATLLIWLTGKRKREEQPIRTLLGPMVLHGGGSSGGGMVMRSKF